MGLMGTQGQGLGVRAGVMAALLVSLPFVGAEASDTEQTLQAEFTIKTKDLPRPNATQSVRNFPQVVERKASDRLLVPEGFEATLFAHEGLEHPRELAEAPNGDIFLSEPNAGRITILRDRDGDGKVEKRFTFVEGMARPYGMAFTPKGLLVADTQALWFFDYETGQTRSTGRRPVTIPGALGSAKGNWTRNIAATADGVFAYVAIGSQSNVAEDPEPRATIQKVRLKDGKRKTFASGLRNPVGLAFHPGTEELYTVVNERDRLGDASVPDYLAKVVVDEFYGWPYAYAGKNPDPEYGSVNPDLVSKTREPDVLFDAHSSPIDIAFYEGSVFPEEYRGDAFVTLRGSWNATRPRGYKIVRVPFENGRPTGSFENFAVGFWRKGASQAEVWGRPTGLLARSDGSLLVADDTGKTIWRISYTTP